MNRIEVGALEIAYRRAGSGPPLVLLHGFLSDSRFWLPQIEDLSREFDVIAWDNPGCGQSTDPPEDFTMAQFAGCLDGFLVALGVGPAHICGLSWGGTCAIQLAHLHPRRVRSLILADTYAGWIGSLGREAGEERLALCLRQSELPPDDWVPGFTSGAVSASCPEDLRNQITTLVSEFHPAGFRAMSRAVTPDFRELLPLIDVPALLIWGDEDERSPLNGAQEMCDIIPGAQLVIIPNAGHLSNMQQPEVFNGAVRKFCLSAQRAEEARS